MCKRCADEVKAMDIRDTDLPMLPYKEAHWQCIVPGCKGKCKVRDYGIAPYYYWPVKVRYIHKHKMSHAGWRGGWVDSMHHAYMCSKHWDPIMTRKMAMPDHSEEVCMSKVVLTGKKQG